MNGRLERMAPLTGVVAVAVGVAAILTYGKTPDFISDSPAKIAAYFNDDPGRVLAGAYVDMFAGLFLLWFAATLRAYLAGHEGGMHRLSNLAFGGIVAAQACFWGANGMMIALAARADDAGKVLSPATTATMFDAAGMMVFVTGALAVGVSLAAVALVGLRHAAMPHWLAYATAAVAVLCIVPFISWIGLLISNVWLLVASVWLYRAMAPAMATDQSQVTPSPPAASATA